MSKNSKKDNISKPWGGRFSSESSGITERISASIHFDSRLYKHDIRGSVAHAGMLKEIGILSDEEYSNIKEGLSEIENEIENETFRFSSSLEDVHMNIEAALTEKIGDTGRKLHTARSRNDQVALDIRMYLRDESDHIEKLIRDLISILSELAKKHLKVILPGYTHMQVAQPVRLSHHLLAYAWKLIRDLKRLQGVKRACDYMPLGSGALAGVNYPNDREYLKNKLGFSHIIHNSMDAVSDRDFILDFLYFSSLLGTHLSGFCEEIILWSTSEFGYIRLGDSVTTGSSIMPQKKNPDIAELIRGKTGRLNGNLISLLTVLKGLPLSYNRDLQEDKEPLFDSVDTVKLSLEGMTEMLKSMEINYKRMNDAVYSNFSTATDLADYLAKKGVPFRESHEIVGNIVKFCEDNRKDFFKLKSSDLKKFSVEFDDDISEVINPESSTERKESSGGTSTAEIEKQIGLISDILG